MARTLAWGRVTMSPNDTGTDPLTEAERKSGFIGAFGNKGVYGNKLDRLIFEAAGYEYILGSAAQLSADFATITYSFSNSRLEDKTGSEVVLQDYDRVAVIGMDTFTANMVIDNVAYLSIFHIGNTPGQSGSDPAFPLGDAGGGVPYKIIFGPNTTGCKLELQTDISFFNLQQFFTNDINIYNARFIVNQGINNLIRVNRCEIYNPCQAGNIITLDTPTKNPYLLRMNGQPYAWQANAAVNGFTWFRDLNAALDGVRLNGTTIVETNSRFTTPALIASNPYLAQVNTANRFFTDISALDTRVHSRADPTGVSISKTVDFNGTNIGTVVGGDITRTTNGLRIQGGTVPSAPAATTIIKNLDISNGEFGMYDALTGAAVNVASASGVTVTLDNSGAAGGSQDADAMQQITGLLSETGAGAGFGNYQTPSTAGAFSGSVVGASGRGAGGAFGDVTDLSFDSANSPSARTHDQTQPISTGVLYYYKA